MKKIRQVDDRGYQTVEEYQMKYIAVKIYLSLEIMPGKNVHP